MLAERTFKSKRIWIIILVQEKTWKFCIASLIWNVLVLNLRMSAHACNFVSWMLITMLSMAKMESWNQKFQSKLELWLCQQPYILQVHCWAIQNATLGRNDLTKVKHIKRRRGWNIQMNSISVHLDETGGRNDIWSTKWKKVALWISYSESVS